MNLKRPPRHRRLVSTKTCELHLGICFLLLVLSLTACQQFPPNIDSGHMFANRENLHFLKVGLTKTEVITIMGQPDDTAHYPRYAKHLEYWKYFTQTGGILDQRYTDGSFTFLAFENGVLQAWGTQAEVVPVDKHHPLWREQ